MGFGGLAWELTIYYSFYKKRILSCASEFRTHLSTSYPPFYHPGEHSIWPSGMNEEGHFIFLIIHLEMNKMQFIYKTEANIYTGRVLKIEDWFLGWIF